MKRMLLCGGVLAAVAMGCAGREYRCPDPVGKIIRDDCSVYRTKYETLKVELGASIVLWRASAKVGRDARLRDPSELLQLLGQRTFALCRDFNACRVSPTAYRQRREQIDRVFTAVASIRQQLEGAALDVASRARLVRELIRVLSEERGAARRGGAGGRGVDGGRKIRYLAANPWHGTRFLPPQPVAAKGRPQIAGAAYSLSHVADRAKGIWGYGLRARFLLSRGSAVRADDYFVARFGELRRDCRLGRSTRGGNGLIGVTCDSGREQPLTARELVVTLSHGREGTETLVGQRRVTVRSRVINPSTGATVYAVGHHRAAERAELVFRPVGNRLPPAVEQPTLTVVLGQREYRRAVETARCWVDGAPVTRALTPSRRSGPVGRLEDERGYLFWRRYIFELPFGAPRDGAALPAELARWPKPGRWRCVVSVDGRPVREARFAVKADGKLVPHADQRQRARAGWLLETRVHRDGHPR